MRRALGVHRGFDAKTFHPQAQFLPVAVRQERDHGHEPGRRDDPERRVHVRSLLIAAASRAPHVTVNVGPLDCFEDRQGIAEQRDSAVGLAQVCIGETEIVQRIALAMTVSYLLHDREVLLVESDGAVWLAECLIDVTETAQRIALTTTIRELPRKCEPPLVGRYGATRLAKERIGVAEITQCIALATTVPDLPRDRDTLLVQRDGLLGLAEGRIGDAEMA